MPLTYGWDDVNLIHSHTTQCATQQCALAKTLTKWMILCRCRKCKPRATSIAILRPLQHSSSCQGPHPCTPRREAQAAEKQSKAPAVPSEGAGFVVLDQGVPQISGLHQLCHQHDALILQIGRSQPQKQCPLQLAFSQQQLG